MDTNLVKPSTSSLMLPSESSSPTYDQHRPAKRHDYVPIPHRWYNVLAYHLAGKKAIEIKQLTGYSIPMIHKILNHKLVLQVRQQLLDATQQEFEALFDQIVDNIRTQLSSDDPNVKLAAQQQWLKANGKFAGVKGTIINNITAEQVVQQILEGGNGTNE